MSRKGYGNTAGEKVLCPLFKAYTANEIRCERHVPDSSVTVLRYGDAEKCRAQRKLYCEKNWKRCEQYLAWKHFQWEDD